METSQDPITPLPPQHTSPPTHTHPRPHLPSPRWYLLCFVHDPENGTLEAVLDGHSEYARALTSPGPLKADTLHVGRGTDIFMSFLGNVSQVCALWGM